MQKQNTLHTLFERVTNDRRDYYTHSMALIGEIKNNSA